MRRIGSIPRGQRLTALALAALVAVALGCLYQVLSGLLGGEIFTGAAGRALWIRWPNVPDLFMRAILFYGLGFGVSAACTAVIAFGLLDSLRNDGNTDPE